MELLKLPQLFQNPAGAQVSGCWPGLTSPRLLWTLCYQKYFIWHEPVPLLESCCSAQSQAIGITRTVIPEEAPWRVQQNSSLFLP